MEDPPFLAGLCGLLFAYLPLLSVYGLSMYGVPLVLWVFLKLAEEECGQEKGNAAKHRKKNILYYLIAAFFGTASSLVLSGFAVLAMGICLGLFWKKARKNAGFWIGMGILLLVYVLCNLDLFAQLVGVGESYGTHKEELEIAAKPFWTTLQTTFINGVEHARAYQRWIVLLAVLVIGAGAIKKEWRSRQWRLVGILFGTAFVIAVLCGWYSWAPVVALRQQIGGGAVWLQLDRIYWLYPALWYAVLGLCLEWLWQLRKWLFWSVGFICFAATAVTVLLAGNWKENVKKLINPDTPGISWQDFYAEDVFAQVEEYLYETTGQRKEDYRVVSLGICPAAALYNGFYCLDGYSNNYPLEYKHAFREIIEPELKKSEYLTEYFDNWGNRCYLFSAQIPAYYTVQKGGFYFVDFSMDTQAFEALGGDYVFSAAYIEGAENTGLTLLREEPFETADSYYRIYIYGLDE